MAVFTNILYIKLQYTHIVMIMLCVIYRLMYASCIYDRWPIVVHISAPNTTEETSHRIVLFIAKTEGYQRKIIFHTFKYIFYNSVFLAIIYQNINVVTNVLQ